MIMPKLMTAGLWKDNQRLHAERVDLWNNFNNCWLALLQRQKDGTQQMLDTGRSPARSQSLLPIETLRRLGEDLIIHADELEPLGLVDYQMGVAEEAILDSMFATARIFLIVQDCVMVNTSAVLGECVDLLATDEEEDLETEPGAQST